MNVTNLHTLLEAVSNSPLASSLGLRESNGSTEWTGSSAVAYAGNADVVDTSNSSIAGHAGRHLDLHGELSASSERDTLDTETWDVLGDLGGLEGSLVSSTGGAIDISSEGAGAVLVDLVDVS